MVESEKKERIESLDHVTIEGLCDGGAVKEVLVKMKERKIWTLIPPTTQHGFNIKQPQASNAT